MTIRLCLSREKDMLSCCVGSRFKTKRGPVLQQIVWPTAGRLGLFLLDISMSSAVLDCRIASLPPTPWESLSMHPGWRTRLWPTMGCPRLASPSGQPLLPAYVTPLGSWRYLSLRDLQALPKDWLSACQSTEESYSASDLCSQGAGLGCFNLLQCSASFCIRQQPGCDLRGKLQASAARTCLLPGALLRILEHKAHGSQASPAWPAENTTACKRLLVLVRFTRQTAHDWFAVYLTRNCLEQTSGSHCCKSVGFCTWI